MSQFSISAAIRLSKMLAILRGVSHDAGNAGGRAHVLRCDRSWGSHVVLHCYCRRLGKLIRLVRLTGTLSSLALLHSAECQTCAPVQAGFNRFLGEHPTVG